MKCILLGHDEVLSVSFSWEKLTFLPGRWVENERYSMYENGPDAEEVLFRMGAGTWRRIASANNLTCELSAGPYLTSTRNLAYWDGITAEECARRVWLGGALTSAEMIQHARIIDANTSFGGLTILGNIIEETLFNNVFVLGFDILTSISRVLKNVTSGELTGLALDSEITRLSHIPDIRTVFEQALLSSDFDTTLNDADRVPSWLIRDRFVHPDTDLDGFVFALMDAYTEQTGIMNPRPYMLYYSAIATWWEYVKEWGCNPDLDEITRSQMVIMK